MSWQTWLTAALIVLAGAAQYGLMAYAIRDLRHRPSVRGNNKVLWALIVLCLPVAGALAYAVYGPTSFRDRPPPPPADPERRTGIPTRLPWLPDDSPDDPPRQPHSRSRPDSRGNGQ